MAANVHLQLFGHPELRDTAGRVLRFRTRKQLALLVYLALEARERGVSRDLLIELLWSDVETERARHSLSQGLSTIRTRLGADAVTRGMGPARLVSRLLTDLDLISNGEARGIDFSQPLKDLEHSGSPTFAHWVDSARVRCLRTAKQALADQLQAARAGGDIGVVHERAAQLYAVDPLSDAAVHALAEQQLLDEDAVGAIRLLRTHLGRLKHELNCNPHPDVERLLRRLESGAVQVTKPMAGSLEKATKPQLEIFVGRAAELSRLEALWEQTRSGRLKTCLVSGPGGIGKSSLVRRFATSVAARAWPVWQIACQEIGINIPFAAASELILTLSRDPAVSGTDPRWLAEASRVTPGLRAKYPGIPEPTPAPAEAIRLRVAEALARMLEAVSDGGPTLMVFDDVQQMDPASRDVCRVLLRRVDALPLLLVATVRSKEQRAFTWAGGSDPVGLPWDAVLEVPPLSIDHATEMVDALVGVGEDAERVPKSTIVDLAQGNPYLIEMLVSDWRHDRDDSLVAAEARGELTAAKWRPPETMRKAFQRQYRGLAGNAEHMLNLLAVAGRQIPVTEMAGLLGIATPHADRSAVELLDRGIVRMESEQLGFKNEMHRAFVYYAMSEDSRKYHHGRMGRQAIENRDANDFQAALEASHHFLKAEMTDRALEAVTRGAESAVTHGAPGEAEKALCAVLATNSASEANRLNLLLARALGAQGKYQPALNALAQWHVADASDRDKATAALVRAEALHRGRLADDDAIREAAQHAARETMRAASEVEQMLAMQISAEVAAESGNPEILRELGVHARRIADTTASSETRALAQLTRGYCFLVAKQWGKAGEAFGLCLSHIGPGLDLERRRALNALAFARHAMGDYSQAGRYYGDAARLAEQIGDAPGASSSWSNLAVIHDHRGLFTTAATVFRKALAHGIAASGPRRLVEVLLNAAGLALTAGYTEDAREMIAHAERLAIQSRHWRLLMLVKLVAADSYLALSDPEAAWQLVEETQHISRGRVYALDNIGRYERLRRHYTWHRYGLSRLQRMAQESASRLHHESVEYQLEIQMFEEWVARVEGTELSPNPSALDRCKQYGSYGLLSGLLAVGIAPRGVPSRQLGEPIHTYLRCIFPEATIEHVPSREEFADYSRYDGHRGDS